ncbi:MULTISPECIES: bestrophin family protein [unclassified Chryseobacterium]|uniref:bestrophin family protein n=1 Tax=unclassified Chryseobacterium TaxID=2593645 RepID=UPI000D717E66|nr:MULTISPECIES: bestrophin family ion channel [unclassified Chryseobacterium]PWW19792.1 putative membrane protein [Chryseobacterium sp. AG844]
MIIRKKEHWFRMLFVWHGSVLPALLPRLGLLLILSLLVTYFHGIILSFKVPLNPAPLTLFGFVLALFLGFRNNASYDRFWEGRKLWGALLNTTRALTRQAMTLSNIKNDTISVHSFVNLLSCFVFALKHQLRGTDAYEDLKSRLNEDQLKIVAGSKYKPAVIMRLLAEWVQKAKDQGYLDSIQQARFDENFDKLSDILGGCERLVSTPIPYSYRVLLHRTVYIYCFLLPFGLVDSLGWFTPLIVVFVAYTFVAFEAIADEIEEPFGTDANDLALNSMCIMIDETIHEMVGEHIAVSQKMTQNIID